MAKRLLLTLLALFGLATQLAPAQARVGAGASSAVGAVMLAAAEDAGAVTRSGLAHRPAETLRLQKAGNFRFRIFGGQTVERAGVNGVTLAAETLQGLGLARG